MTCVDCLGNTSLVEKEQVLPAFFGGIGVARDGDKKPSQSE